MPQQDRHRDEGQLAGRDSTVTAAATCRLASPLLRRRDDEATSRASMRQPEAARAASSAQSKGKTGCVVVLEARAKLEELWGVPTRGGGHSVQTLGQPRKASVSAVLCARPQLMATASAPRLPSVFPTSGTNCHDLLLAMEGSGLRSYSCS
eukprot:3424106-Rhodomonas_salina.3